MVDHVKMISLCRKICRELPAVIFSRANIVRHSWRSRPDSPCDPRLCRPQASVATLNHGTQDRNVN